MSSPLGKVIREARRREKLSQASLSELAGISKRQLAAIENGANTSVRVVTRLAEVLQLKEIPLGPSAARPAYPSAFDPRVAGRRASAAESLILEAAAAVGHLRSAIAGDQKQSGESIADRPLEASSEGAVAVPLLAEMIAGRPLRYTSEWIEIDRFRVESGEAVIRVRSRKGTAEGIGEGDLLIVELRPDSTAATGELVIVLIEGNAYLGRWWNKRGRRLLRGPRTGRTLREIGPGEAAIIFGAVTDVLVRGRS